jgi:hypothetical protein
MATRCSRESEGCSSAAYRQRSSVKAWHSRGTAATSTCSGSNASRPASASAADTCADRNAACADQIRSSRSCSRTRTATRE